MLGFLFITSLTSLGLAGLYFWLRTIARLQQFQVILPARPTFETPFGLVDVTIMFFTWIAGQFGFTMVAIWWLQIDPTDWPAAGAEALGQMTGIVAVGQLLSTVAGMLMIYVRYLRWDIFGWQRSFIGPDIRLGGIAFVMVVPSILMLQWLLTWLVKYNHSTLDVLSDSRSLLTIGCTWLAAVIVAPLCEEIFFRGVLQAWLQRLVDLRSVSLDQLIVGGWNGAESVAVNAPEISNSDSEISGFAAPSVDDPNPYRSPLAASGGLSSGRPNRQQAERLGPLSWSSARTSWMPIIVSATIFAAVHIGQGAAPIPLFVLGLVLGFLYRQTGSILSCIVLHLGLNAFSMFWFTVQVLSHQ